MTSFCAGGISLLHLSYIHAGNRDEFFHAVDDFVRIQYADVERAITKVHDVPQIDRDVSVFGQKEDPLGTVVSAYELPRLTGSEDLAFSGGVSELVPQTRLKAHSRCPTLKGLLMLP